MTVGLVLQDVGRFTWLAHLSFPANLPLFWFTPLAAGFWSLFVEAHFYLLVVVVVMRRWQACVNDSSAECLGRDFIYMLHRQLYFDGHLFSG
jgi:peptidoglycan/LPS O-acetylase OafA/YrhL